MDKASDDARGCTHCLVCAEPIDGNQRLFSVVVCGHDGVCSVCYLRDRGLRRNGACFICKAQLDRVICVDARGTSSPATATFGSFTMWGEDDIGSAHVFDPKTSMFFPKAYYKRHVEKLWQIRCKVCDQPKRDVKALKSHLASEHSMFLCLLCAEHRCAFPSELCVYSQAQYDVHLSRGSGSGETGHPRCDFCKKRYYDKSELYLHLSRDHFSCFLCERQGVQFQYYNDYGSLEEHLRGNHFLCDDPTCLQTRFVAFANDIDFLAHCRQFHPFATVSRARPVTLGFHFGSANNAGSSGNSSSGGSGSGSGSGIGSGGYGGGMHGDHGDRRGRGDSGGPRSHRSLVSASSSSSGPATTDDEERRRQLSHLQTTAAISSAPLVPRDMKVAGRIVGGRFLRGEGDSALEMTAGGGVHLSPSPGIGSFAGQTLQSSFPTLASSVKNAAGASAAASGAAAPELHPMSLVQQKQREAAAKKAAESEAKARDTEEDERMSQRSRLMADAFGILPTSASAAAAAAAASAAQAAAATGTSGPPSRNQLWEAPIYPPMLITWARKFRPELLKLEKKVAELFADKRSSSVQLKPMPPSMRAAVHGVARHALLNSFEFDPDPKRYVSLVRTADSRPPALLLSAASNATFTPLPPSGQLHSLNEPVLYFTRRNPPVAYGVTPTESRAKAKSVESAAAKGGLVTVCDVARHVQQALQAAAAQSAALCRRGAVADVRLVGPSSVAVHFVDLSTAAAAMDLFAPLAAAATTTGETDVASSPVAHPPDEDTAYLVECFHVDCAFDRQAVGRMLAERRVEEENLRQMQVAGNIGSGSGAADDMFPGRRAAPIVMPCGAGADVASQGAAAVTATRGAGGLKLDTSVLASLHDEWEAILGDGEDGGNKNLADMQQPGDDGPHDAGSSAESDGGLATTAPAPTLEPAPAPAPAPEPAVYRRLQLAPRTLPPPLRSGETRRSRHHSSSRSDRRPASLPPRRPSMRFRCWAVMTTTTTTWVRKRRGETKKGKMRVPGEEKLAVR